MPYLAAITGLILTGNYAQVVEDVKGEAPTLYIKNAVRSLIDLASAVKPVVIVLEALDHHSSQLLVRNLLKTINLPEKIR